MTDASQNLLSILEIEPLELDLYRGRTPSTSSQRVFGGQVIAQALVAAQRTVEGERYVHSLHGYFMLGGDPSIPILYQVGRLRDGGSFTTRRVTAIQHGRAIFSLEASFQVDEEGLDYQAPMPPNVPMPEELLSQREIAERHGDRLPAGLLRVWARERPIELRPTNLDHFLSNEKLPPQQWNWLRFRDPVPDDRRVQAALLAYLSDFTLLDTATLAHGRNIFEPEIQVASLDHAMWFHRSHSLDGWLLYSQDSPSTSGSRGFTRGALYGRDGTLIASVAQEGLIRLRTKQTG